MFINNVTYLKQKLLELLNMKSENFLYVCTVRYQNPEKQIEQFL